MRSRSAAGGSAGAPPKVTILGAGSARFTRKLIGDLLLYPELQRATIALHDIDPARLETGELIVQRLASSVGATPVIETSLDRRAAIRDSDFVINTIQVGGLEATRLDFEVPARFGLHYAINDTINVGGVMRALRTIPVVAAIVRDMEEIAPSAWLLNYTNPMSMVVWYVSAVSPIKIVGLCHSVETTVKRLAKYLQIPHDEIEYYSAGINHLAFVLSLSHRGEDLYPRLRQFVMDGRVPKDDLVRAEIFERYGYYPTESSEHHSDYSPWFTAKNLVERFNIPIDDLVHRDQRGLDEYIQFDRELRGGLELQAERSDEYAALIVHSMITGSPNRIIANVMNGGRLIGNLPAVSCVEVPAYVDGYDIHPGFAGDLPAQCAAYMGAALATQATTVAAILNHDPDLLFHAVLQDPMVQTGLTLDQARDLTDQLLDAERQWMPPWVGGMA